MSFRRLTSTAAGACLAVASTAAVIVGSEPSASAQEEMASPICISAAVTGAANAGAGRCVPTGLSTLCVTQRVGIDPTLMVTAEACLPGG